MRQFKVALAVLLMVGIMVVPLIAQEKPGTVGEDETMMPMSDQDMDTNMHMMNRGRMDKNLMMGMHMMGMGRMMKNTSMVATSDGGVVVLMGNKLYKYDKDLMLQKQTEIKIVDDAMQHLQYQREQMSPACTMPDE